MIATSNGNKVILEFEISNINQSLIDLLSMMENTNKSNATDEDISKLANEITSGWWEKNKDRLLNENRH